MVEYQLHAQCVEPVNEPDLLYRNVILSEYLRITSHKKLVSMRYWNEVYVTKKIDQTVASTGLAPGGIDSEIFSVR